MSSGKVFAPALAPGAVPAAATNAGLTGAAAGHAATTGLATVATAAGTALLAVGAAATAVVLTRVVMGGIRDFGESIVSGAEAWAVQRAEADRWQGTVLQVVDANARLAALRAAARGNGGTPDPDLPEPLNPTGMDLPALRRWCAETEKAIERAEERQADQVMEEGMAWLARRRGQRTDAADELARRLRQARHRQERVASRSTPEPRTDGIAEPARTEIGEAVQRILGRMAPETTREEAASLLEAADKALSTRNLAAATSWLGELRIREQSVDAAVLERRGDITAAVRYLAALRLEDVSAELFPAETTAEFAPIVRRLEAVAAGTEPLTPDLRRAAEDAVLRAQDLADERLITETLAAACAGLGYQVRRGTDAAFMAITRPGWDGDAVRFEQSDGRITATFEADGDASTVALDAERLRRWRDDFARLRADTDDLGLELNLVGMTEPGDLTPGRNEGDQGTAEHEVSQDADGPDGERRRHRARQTEYRRLSP
jgi:hypothetical protein